MNEESNMEGNGSNIAEDEDVGDFIVNMNDVEEVDVANGDDAVMESEDEDDAQEMEDGEDQEEVLDTAKVTIRSHEGPVYAIASHHHVASKTIVVLSGGGDDAAFAHIIRYEEPQHQGTENQSEALVQSEKLSQHSDTVAAVALHADSQESGCNYTSAIGSYDGRILVHKMTLSSTSSLQDLKFALWTELEGPSDVESISFHQSSGTVLLVGSQSDATIWMYHIPQKQCLQVFCGHAAAAGSISSVAFRPPQEKRVLSASMDGTLRLWSPKTGVCQHVFECGTEGTNANDGAAPGLTCMATFPATSSSPTQHHHLVLVGCENGMTYLCHAANASPKIVATLQHAQDDNATMSQQHDNQGGDDDENQEVVMTTSVEAVTFCPVSASADSMLLWCATGGMDGAVKIWDIGQGQGHCRHVCRLDDNSDAGITRLQWCQSYQWVVASYTHGSIVAWDPRNGAAVRTWTGHVNVVNDLNITSSAMAQTQEDEGTRSGEWIVSASDDNTIKLYTL